MNALFVGLVAGIGVKLFAMMQTFVDTFVAEKLVLVGHLNSLLH